MSETKRTSIHERIGSEPPSKYKWEIPPPTPVVTISDDNNSNNNNDSIFPKKFEISGYFYYYNNFNNNFKHKKLMYFVLSNNFLLGALNKFSKSLNEIISIDNYTIKLINNNNIIQISNKKIDTNKRHKNQKFFYLINSDSCHNNNNNNIECKNSSNKNNMKLWFDHLQRGSKLTIKDLYTELHVINHGSQGTKVVSGINKKNGKRVAIKVIIKKNIIDKRRLSQEINIMNVLSNKQPCIVKLYDVFESKKNLYLIMEYCETDLMQILNDNYKYKKISQSLTCHIMHQIARAVDFMHRKHIVHRDLKPENILCVKKNALERIKVADFGISKHLKDINRNLMNTPVGTLTYTAPELLNGQQYGKEVDCWALGVIMHIMLCGYSPWNNCQSEIEIRRSIQDGDVQLNERDWAHVSYKIKDLVLRLLNRNPDKRATIKEILKITNDINKNKNTFDNNHKYKTSHKRHTSSMAYEIDSKLMSKVFNKNNNNNNNCNSYNNNDVLGISNQFIQTIIEQNKLKNNNNNSSDDDQFPETQTSYSFFDL